MYLARAPHRTLTSLLWGGLLAATIAAPAPAQGTDSLSSDDSLALRIAAWRYALGPARPTSVLPTTLLCLAYNPSPSDASTPDQDPTPAEQEAVKGLDLKARPISQCTDLSPTQSPDPLLVRLFPVTRSAYGDLYAMVLIPPSGILTVYFRAKDSSWVAEATGWESF